MGLAAREYIEGQRITLNPAIDNTINTGRDDITLRINEIPLVSGVEARFDVERQSFAGDNTATTFLGTLSDVPTIDDFDVYLGGVVQSTSQVTKSIVGGKPQAVFATAPPQGDANVQIRSNRISIPEQMVNNEASGRYVYYLVIGTQHQPTSTTHPRSFRIIFQGTNTGNFREFQTGKVQEIFMSVARDTNSRVGEISVNTDVESSGGPTG